MADGGEDSRSVPPAGAGAGHGTAPPRLIGTLDPVLRPYGWGSTTAIPSILGVPGTGAPVAEAWYGAHPSAPSRRNTGIYGSEYRNRNRLIASY